MPLDGTHMCRSCPRHDPTLGGSVRRDKIQANFLKFSRIRSGAGFVIPHQREMDSQARTAHRAHFGLCGSARSLRERAHDRETAAAIGFAARAETWLEHALEIARVDARAVVLDHE